MNERTAISVFKQATAILKSHKLPFWLDSGTLLGAVRDQRFIPWDNDVDLGIWRTDWDVALEHGGVLSDFDSAGFQFYLLPDKLVVEKFGIPINLAIYDLIDERASRSTLLYGNKLSLALKIVSWVLSVHSYNNLRRQNLFNVEYFAKHALLILVRPIPFQVRIRLAEGISTLSAKCGGRPITFEVPLLYFQGLSQVPLYGEAFDAPSNQHQYLVFRYGEDWQIPIRAWTPADQDGAVTGPQRIG